MAARHNPILPLLAALALVSSAFPCYGRTQNATAASQPGQAANPIPLGAVSASGSAKFTSAQIATATGLKPGEPVNRKALQVAANRLASTGLFSSVHYRFSSLGGKVNVQFQVADARTLHVSFDNFPWFTDRQLSEDIRKQIGLFDGTSPESGSYVHEIAAAIETQLRAVGVQGRVEHRLIERPVGSGREVQFRLVGVTLNVASVRFTDPLAQNDERVEDRLEDLIGKPFSRYYTDVFVAEQVQPIYLSQGYLQVRFGSPEARFSGNPNQENPDQVLIVVPVHRGKKYAFGGIHWNGNTVFDADTLNRMVGLRSGQTADGLAIEAGWQKVRQEYGSKGYLDAALNVHPSFDNAKATVSYNVHVTEGQPYGMGKLVISGLSVKAERRVRRAWLIRPGQTFDLDYYRAFLADIAKKALAGMPVHYQHIGRYLQRNKNHTVDVMLDFE